MRYSMVASYRLLSLFTLFHLVVSLVHPLIRKLIPARGRIDERGREADGLSATARFAQPTVCTALMIDAHPHAAIGQPFHLQPTGRTDPGTLAAADARGDIDDHSPLIRLL
jgi:hypothetical protein